jgi:hypothetical protein
MDITREKLREPKKYDSQDIWLSKLSAAAFVLMLGKLWEPLFSLDWYWYAVVFVLAATRPFYKAFFT